MMKMQKISSFFENHELFIADNLKWKIYFVWMVILLLSAVGYSSFIAFNYKSQPLIDLHAFRQTQTALTAYWLSINGFSFDYETPVAGFPWSIPFEFPIYQYIASFISRAFNVSLDQTGRILSYLFLLGCIWPVAEIFRILKIPKITIVVFATLFLSSPLYLYWGRTFMIETAVLFFSLASLSCGISILLEKINIQRAIAFLFFSTLAILQKSTTEGPILLFLLIVVWVRNFYNDGAGCRTSIKPSKFSLLIFAVLFIGVGWAHYADTIKIKNLFGMQLTSDALSSWNFGSLEQRISFSTWYLIIWSRAFKDNIGGLLGLVIFLAPFLMWRGDKYFLKVALLPLALFVLPVLIFTNLYFVHEYYQVSNLVFIIFSVSILIGAWFPSFCKSKMIIPVLMMPIMALNFYSFNNYYANVIGRPIDQQDSRSVKAYMVGKYLYKNTPQNSSVAIFGLDWSSEVAFNSRRKTFTAPPWFDQYEDLLLNPQKYMGELPLSAIVICPNKDVFPAGFDLLKIVNANKSSKKVVISDCTILLSQ